MRSGNKQKIDRLVKSGRRGERFLSFTDTVKDTLIGADDPGPRGPEPIIPVTPSKPVIPSKPVTTTISNPEVEIDFSTLSCAELETKISWLENLFMVARMTGIAMDYYNNKLTQAKQAYAAKCGNSGVSVPPTLPPDTPSPSGTGTVKPVPGTTVNIGNDAITGGLVSSGTGGDGLSGGGGGGGSNDQKKAAKKKNWWWLLLVAGALGACVYYNKGKTV